MKKRGQATFLGPRPQTSRQTKGWFVSDGEEKAKRNQSPGVLRWSGSHKVITNRPSFIEWQAWGSKAGVAHGSC